MEATIHQLHNRAVQGEPLTLDEHAQLQAWYAQQDAAEWALLSRTDKPHSATLQSQLAASLKRLAEVSQRIAALSEENEALRRANTALQQEFAADMARKAA